MGNLNIILLLKKIEIFYALIYFKEQYVRFSD